MALTGLVLTLFVVGHMLGNLQVYLGPKAFNAYGVFLREVGHGFGLWAARAALLLTVGLHIWVAVSLTRENLAARPVGYRQVQRRKSTYASRTMMWSGPILALFVVYHLLHFTTGTAHQSFIEGDVYHNVITGFSVWPLRLASLIGFVFTGFGSMVLIYVIGRYLLEGTSVAGFPFLASIISLFAGAQLFAIGIIGEYLARMYFRVMDRPPYVIESTVNFQMASGLHSGVGSGQPTGDGREFLASDTTAV